ncbi:hypothetical protein [Roseinatronobacter bogoriensis]|uniref:hypothetical protein n=1 Tax=Roseinatronobacter bogoriensis TaxID=119542 RepID=UPI00145628D5|nr:MULTISPECIES: hypothetical protein [Rhodobaca]MBB4209190.1 hypothetical protein [Rhodobaca bogoriensis DSM 18756]
MGHIPKQMKVPNLWELFGSHAAAFFLIDKYQFIRPINLKAKQNKSLFVDQNCLITKFGGFQFKCVFQKLSAFIDLDQVFLIPVVTVCLRTGA